MSTEDPDLTSSSPPLIMLNAAKLSELLTKNADTKLYPRIFVMSPNGTLMAYSTPVDIKELRDQAALISMAWKEHSTSTSTTTQPQQPPQTPSPTTQEPPKPPPQTQNQNPTDTPTPTPNLETLTIETSTSNILIRAIQPSLLLILVGSVPPSHARRNVFKITPEAYGNPRYPPSSLPSPSTPASPAQNPASSGGDDSNSAPKKSSASSIRSTMSTREKDIKLGALHIQRKKLDALTEYVRRDFEERGFVMPDDSSFP
ncbi:hypothetical protein CC80DRAFT_494960 [Byssothecium circinans]|uniref:Uncharacterized protein n=1 Tax=Byssothecium circinans TaxID=147558 RepID=A0A6A5TK60_9PLEO|nr:hypothetical protein CC80DRAFT_494960 [Byssothecium circinans]